MTLTPCTDLSAARWLMDDPQPWGFQLLTVGPAGFPAYARLRFPPEVLDGPRLQLWGRAYYLFRGALTDFGDWGGAEMWPGQPRFAMPDPGFIWPAARAWCVANDVDPPWAGLSGSVPAVDEVLALGGVDVVRVDPERDRPGDG
ncbi:hypothetical protein [Actinoplanes awajinensis]|uniref:hypothetical protein n=1 Tax=Actinoplanes awajinensis TaxID=135946 RepID=UPI000A000083|nr:hypothetical protein [Actinoplanes awajinensis]